VAYSWVKKWLNLRWMTNFKAACDIRWPWWATLILTETGHLWVGKFKYNDFSTSCGHLSVTCYAPPFPTY
jgi:hypothetical protein